MTEHYCPNCAGISPSTCPMNPDRAAAKQRPAEPRPYAYTDPQNHRMSVFKSADATGRPYVWLEADNLAPGGTTVAVWLPVEEAGALDVALDHLAPFEYTDHTGDTLTVKPADDWTRFEFVRASDDDEEPATVRVVVLTARLSEVRAAIRARIEQIEAAVRAAAAPTDAEVIEFARTLGLAEPEKAPAFLAALRDTATPIRADLADGIATAPRPAALDALLNHVTARLDDDRAEQPTTLDNLTTLWQEFALDEPEARRRARVLLAEHTRELATLLDRESRGTYDDYDGMQRAVTLLNEHATRLDGQTRSAK